MLDKVSTIDDCFLIFFLETCVVNYIPVRLDTQHIQENVNHQPMADQ